MKTIIKTSRLAGHLEKLYNKLNADFFDGMLEPCIITIQSTPKAYGHYSVGSVWNVAGGTKHEINIGAGTLDRNIEYTVATMIHEMVHHYCNTVLHEPDTSNKGRYHNGVFQREAEAHGLICHQNGSCGWSDTSSEISDNLIEWILENNINEILMNRDEPTGIRITGGHTAANGTSSPAPTSPKGNSYKFICPCCNDSVRATKPTVQPGCWKCMVPMVPC